MSTGAMADGFVELQLKADKLQAEMRQVIADTTKTATAAEKAFGTIADKGVKKTTDALIIQRMEMLRLGSEYKKARTWAEWNQTRTVSSYSKIADMAHKGMGLAGTIAGATAGLIFAAAAAAGSTTLDTLTGSIKMLSLAAGGKVQDSIKGISKWIQSLAHSVDKMDASTIFAGGGALTGAGIGYKLGGIRGGVHGTAIGAGAGLVAGGQQSEGYALIGASIGTMIAPGIGTAVGAAVGDLYGTIKETKMTGDYTKDLANKLANDPDKLAKAIGQANKIEKMGGPGPAAAEMIREAVKQVEVMRKADPEAFKSAGLGYPGSFTGLADLRQQAQLAVFGKGPLETDNMVRELQNNQRAINNNTDAINGKGNVVQPGNVAVPAP